VSAASWDASAWDPPTFEAALRAKGQSYHIHHPFNLMLNEGRASPGQIRGWVANRFYYQVNIPRKDAAVLANCPDRETRRQWVRRILDHDGVDGDPGGIEAWVRLGEAVGIARADLWSMREVVPGVRFAVDAYVNFARQQPWQESVCASLTELFAPQIHKDRLKSWPIHYPWIDTDGLD
jgi:pyrroloquinoline-quinone synthase